MRKIKQLFLNDTLIFVVILLNSITIFLEGFEEIDISIKQIILIADTIFTIIFVLEAIIKIAHFGWRKYIYENWNKLDFILVIISIPSFLIFFNDKIPIDLSFLLILRIFRVFRFFKFFRFIPGIGHLLKGIQRALKTSIFVLLVFLIYNLLIAVFSCYLFKSLSPDLFGNPLKSFYSIFQVFTVEGWYEIPQALIQEENSISEFFIKTYFVIILITGGIFGLSLVNSIFVDSMVSDNTDELEAKIDRLEKKIDKLLEKK